MSSENGNMPASPMDSVSAIRAEEGHYDVFAYGLTKREHFAAMAMQGLIASIGQHDVTDYDEMASDAVLAANALLKALEK